MVVEGMYNTFPGQWMESSVLLRMMYQLCWHTRSTLYSYYIHTHTRIHARMYRLCMTILAGTMLLLYIKSGGADSYEQKRGNVLVFSTKGAV